LVEVVVENFWDAEIARQPEKRCWVFGSPEAVSAQHRSEAQHVAQLVVEEMSTGSSLLFCRCY